MIPIKVFLKQNTNITLSERFRIAEENNKRGNNWEGPRRNNQGNRGYLNSLPRSRGAFSNRGYKREAYIPREDYNSRAPIISYVRGGGGRGYFNGSRRPYGVQRGRVMPRRDPREDPVQLQKQLIALEKELQNESREGYRGGGRRGFRGARNFPSGRGRGQGRGGRGRGGGRGGVNIKQDPEQLKRQLDLEMDEYQQQTDV